MTFNAALFRSLAILVLSSIGLAGPALADARVALVIGNSDYLNSPKLKNPTNDATAISAKLTSLGFDVTEGYDLTYDELRSTVRAFASDIRNADLAIFYYAGHGISVDGENYMVPVDARMNDPFDWEFEVYAVADVLRILDRAPGPSLVFLDACRDNPMAQVLAQVQGMSTRSLSTRGLNRVSTDTVGTSGSVIAYATEPGQVANDGTGDNSPFTKALLNNIDAVNTDFATVTSLITRDVLGMTDGAQRPRFDVSLNGPLMLNQVAPETPTIQKAVVTTAPVAPAVPRAAPSPEIETVIFQTALETGDIADYEAYLAAFPNGSFVALAENAIARIEKKQQEDTLETSTAKAFVPGTPAAFGAITAPLALTASPAVRAMPSSEFSERQLAFTDKQSREVQLRLNLSGNNVGPVDGQIGPGTRRGIGRWQAQQGFAATGYLNAVQHQMLVANTQVAFTAHMASNPTALAPPTWRRAPSGNTTRTRTKQRVVKKRNTINPQVGAFLGGVAAGVLLKRR